MNSTSSNSVLGIAKENSGTGTEDATFLGTAAFLSIPIIILWYGMAMAQKFSIASAGAVTKGAMAVGKKATLMTYGQNQYKNFKKEREKRVEDKTKTSLGVRLGKGANNWQDAGLAKLGSSKAQKRLDNRRMDANKKNIEDDSKDLIDKGATVDTLAGGLNRSFHAAPPTDKKEKVKQAAQAQAYLKQEADDRKTHILNQLKSATGANAAGSEIEHILNAAYVNDPKLDATANAAKKTAYDRQRDDAKLAATAVTNNRGVNSEGDMRTVHSFVNRQMKSKIETGANA